MTVTTSSARHLLVSLAPAARLPEAILNTLRDEVVLAGWMRASGVLSEVKLRVGTGGMPEHVEGILHVIALDGSIGLVAGDVSCGMRAVLVRDGEAGREMFAGEIIDARVEALEMLVMAFDDVTAARRLDLAGAWVLDPVSADVATASQPVLKPIVQTPAAPRVTASSVSSAPVSSGFGDFVRASEVAHVAAERPAPAPLRATDPQRQAAARPSPTFSANNQAMPQRITRPAEEETEDDPVPEPGDTVEHFAFGRCEVVKTEGDRLHVRLVKDQRIKEIALEMLKVTPLPVAAGQTSRHWQLARKL